MKVIQTIAVSTLLFHFCTAQLFPFSNLRAFFEPKHKPGRDGGGVSSPANVSRPHRQTEHDPRLPVLTEFSSPDIFEINREEDSGRTVERHPPSPTSGWNSGKHRINTHLVVRDLDDDQPVFITPKPNQHTEYGTEEYSKIRSKNRTRKRKPQDVEPEVQQSEQDERYGEYQHPGSLLRASPSPTLYTSEGTYVESVPSLAVKIEDDFSKPKANNGLVDYLVPPKLPSVYEKALKLLKGKPHLPGSKLKAPAPTSLSKKESRFRPKKHHEGAALTERTTKRHTGRRRPIHPRDHRKAARKPPVEAVAAQMDEQITSETGFTGVGGGTAAGGSHGDQRVEFQMHGQKGPNSYKFGYDTGKGHNRQFRFEEKDNHGRVKGHYGYYDKEGKLQVVNYEADPHTGFKAETV